MDAREAEVRILALAEQVVESRDELLPQMLCDIQSILDSCPLGSEAVHVVKQRVLDCQLGSMCLDSLALDYNSCSGGWRVAGKLALTMVNCFIGVEPTNEDEFRSTLLPGAASGFVTVLHRVQRQYTASRRSAGDPQTSGRTKVLEMRRALLSTLANVGDALVALCTWQPVLASRALQHTEWVHIASCPSPSLGAIGLDVLYKLLDVCSATQLASLGSCHMEEIVDVLMSRLILDDSGSETGSIVASTSTLDVTASKESLGERATMPASGTTAPRGSSKLRRVQLAFAIVRHVLGTGACSAVNFSGRYYSHADTIQQWRGVGFDDDVHAVSRLLKRKAAKVQHEQKKQASAIRIQSHWRAHSTRHRWKQIQRATLMLQRWWRQVQTRRTQRQEKERLLSVATFQSGMSQTRTSVRRRQAQSKSLQHVAADQVGTYVRDNAAITIQSHWRGRVARQSITRETAARLERKRDHAARCIQRTFLRRRARRARRQQQLTACKDTVATDADVDGVHIHDLIGDILDYRRIELQREITRYRDQNPVECVSAENLQYEHECVEEAWARFQVSVAPQSQRLVERIDSLVVRMQSDVDTLLSLGDKTLEELVDAGGGALKCASSGHRHAIRSVAKARHEEALSRVKLRWWEYPVDSPSDWPV